MSNQLYTCPSRGPMQVNLPMELKCPFCPGTANLHPRIFVYRKKSYLTFSYKCDKCKEDFSTTDSDEAGIGSLIRDNIKKKQLIMEVIKSVLKIKTT